MWWFGGGGNILGSGIKTSTIFKSLSPLPTPECLLWGLRLCWEKYLNFYLLPAASQILPGFCFLPLLSFPIPHFLWKVPWERLQGQLLSHLPLFLSPLVKFPSELVFLFGFDLTVSKPRPHTERTTNAKNQTSCKCVYSSGMVAYKRTVDNNFKEEKKNAFKLIYVLGVWFVCFVLFSFFFSFLLVFERWHVLARKSMF